MKKTFLFSRSFTVHSDDDGNFFLVTNISNEPVTIYQIDGSNKVSILEGPPETDFWPSTTKCENSNKGTPPKSFLINGFSPNEKPHVFRYKLYLCNDMAHSTFLNLDSSFQIEKYSLIDQGQRIIYVCFETDSISIYSLAVDGQSKPVLVGKAPVPWWGYVTDEQNNLYYATENGITKANGVTGERIWHTPIELQNVGKISNLSINSASLGVVVSFIDEGPNISLRTLVFSHKTGDRTELEPYIVNHNSWYYPPNFIRAQEKYGCLWRIVDQGRGSIILRLAPNGKSWELMERSSIMFPRKFFICEEDKFIVVGNVNRLRVERIQNGERELLFNHRECNNYDFVLSAKNQLGIYMDHKGNIQFVKMDV